MKKLFSVTFIALFVLMILSPATTVNAQTTDVPSSWAEATIDEVKALDLLRDSVFTDYQQPITREEFSYLIVVLYQAITGEDPDYASIDSFDDTSDLYILKAYHLGLVNGYGNNMFGPDDPITREQIAVMFAQLGLLLNHTSEETTSDLFNDDSSFSAWAKEGIYYCKDMGIISGTGDNLFNPHTTSTKEQALILFNNSLNTLSDKRVKGDDSAPIVDEPEEPAVDESELEPNDPQPIDDPTDEVVTYNAKEIAELCSSAVFFIENYDPYGVATTYGSGFFIDDKGTAITSYHVIQQEYSSKVYLTDGSVYDVVEVLGYDDMTDIAIIRVDVDKKVDFLQLGDSDALSTGERIFTLGSPQGLSNTISEGIISNTNRLIYDISYLQITAPISGGSSGGALINEHAQVVGIITAYYEDGQNLNLATPINQVADVDNNVGRSLQELYLTYEDFPVIGNLEDYLIFYEFEPNDYLPDFVITDTLTLGIFDDIEDVDRFYFNLEETSSVIAIAKVEDSNKVDHAEYLLMAIFDFNSGDLIEISTNEMSSDQQMIAMELAPGEYEIYMLPLTDYAETMFLDRYTLFFQSTPVNQ